MSEMPVSPRVKAVQEYYRRLDAGEFPADLFAKDFQFCFPKYGVGHGAAAFSELFSGMMCAVKRVAHHLDTMLFIEQGNCVAAEGTTEGTDVLIRSRQLRRNYFSRSESSIAGHSRSKFFSCWRPCLSKASTLCSVSGQVNAI